MIDSDNLRTRFERLPLNWEPKSARRQYSGVWLELDREADEEVLGAYEVFIGIYSEEFGKFLKLIANAPPKDAEYPRVRQKPRKRVVGGFAQASLGVQQPGKSLDPAFRLVDGPYNSNSKLVPLGYNTISEARLQSFLFWIDDALKSEAGLYKAHMKDGFINRDLGHFDIFWGFVFSAYRAGISAADCAPRIREAVQSHYVERIVDPSANDIQILYDYAERATV